MIPFKNAGRSIGFWYLLLILLGPLRLLYIPKTLFVSGDATSTISNILAHETLFRFGMVSDLICAVLLVVVTLAFYRLFENVSQHLGAWVVILGGVMPAVLAFADVGTDNSALYIAHGPAFLSVFDKPQRDALAMLILHARDRETTAAELLWGLWLIRSRFLPRFTAVWLFFNAAAYVAVSFIGLLLPDIEGSVFSLTTPARLGELVITLWLLVQGAEPTKGRTAVT